MEDYDHLVGNPARGDGGRRLIAGAPVALDPSQVQEQARPKGL